jgi:hypothetical protein
VVKIFTYWLQYTDREAPKDEELPLEDNVFDPVLKTIGTTLFEQNNTN